MIAGSRIMDEMVKEAFGREHGFEGNMIANERYREAMSDETGLLYAKLALIVANLDRVRSRTFAEKSLDYINKKLRFEANSQSLEKLKKILEIIMSESTPIDTKEGLEEISRLNESINNNLEDARSRYYQVLKS